LDDFIAWVVNERKWLFSGVGVVVLSFVANLIIKKIRSSTSQTIRTGNHSTNIQAGQNARVEIKKTSDVGEE
jgi:hypothetical protein